MLISLHVKNLALIEETEVIFGEGLNILTGETGAGKSIIIGSISLALGAKADKDIIRNGCDHALIELVFQLNDMQKKSLQDLGIILEKTDDEEDEMVVISRRIMPGRSLCKVNGENVTTKQLRDIAGVMLDLYGQHDHQKLLSKKQHREILDSYAGEEMERLLSKASKTYRELKDVSAELLQSEGEDSARGKDLSLAEFEVHEIDEAKLIPGEEKDLEIIVKKGEHSKRILEAVGNAHEMLAGDYGTSALDAVSKSLREIGGVLAYDPALGEIESQLQDIESLVDDCRRALSGYRDGMDLDEESYMVSRERLDLIHHLQDKYGEDIEDILAYRDQRQALLDKYADFDGYLMRLREKKKEVLSAYQKVADQITELRIKTGKKLKKNMENVLPKLNFPHVMFEVNVSSNPDDPSAQGVDDIEFMISTNPGEPVKPVGNVASGGELSRIMLGLKTIIAQKDAIDTLIFDEIDTGISGKTAWQVAQRLGALAKDHQVICITHLPQIAAMADRHFCIEKTSDEKQTTTQIDSLSAEESIRELARLLGGDTMTDAVLTNAKEMKQLAKNNIEN